MAHPLQNYLRTFRKRADLSQREMAMLLGCSDGSEVSRYERFARRPTLATAFLYEQLFGVSLRELFAGVYDEAREVLHDRARLLAKQLEEQPNASGGRKRQLLVDLLSNLSSQPKQ